MKHRISGFGITAAGVLVLVFLLGQRTAFSQSASPSPDTAWIEAQMVEQNPEPALPIVEAPDSVGSNAAILAAQILLAPIDFGLHLPIILR